MQVEEEIEIKPPFPLYSILLFLLYLVIVLSLTYALVVAVKSDSAETRVLAPSIITAITTIAGFAVGVNAAPKTPPKTE